ncbi:MAG: hypothetical protein EU532_05465 [Promethearchaeota archaeon]|nr:MAG: hypothetical protein EU532_05465 [Candidatus Lokiarchaeota archaeon]
MLLLKSWMFLIVYGLIWLFIIFVGRALVCRHCDFLGKKCVTWCMGIIGSKIYKLSDKKDFTEIKIWKFWLDVVFIAIALLFPIFIYFYYFFRVGLTLVDWILVVIYFIVGLLTFLIHNIGCKKFIVKGCPFRPKSH